MTNKYDNVVEALREAMNEQQQKVAVEQIKLTQMQEALKRLTDPNAVLVTDIKRTDYLHMGIIEAAKAWLLEVGEAQRTEAIAKALLERGIKTKSKRMTPNVYATLNNSDEFIRDGDKWKLRKGHE